MFASNTEGSLSFLTLMARSFAFGHPCFQDCIVTSGAWHYFHHWTTAACQTERIIRCRGRWPFLFSVGMEAGSDWEGGVIELVERSLRSHLPPEWTHDVPIQKSIRTSIILIKGSLAEQLPSHWHTWKIDEHNIKLYKVAPIWKSHHHWRLWEATSLGLGWRQHNFHAGWVQLASAAELALLGCWRFRFLVKPLTMRRIFWKHMINSTYWYLDLIDLGFYCLMQRRTSSSCRVVTVFSHGQCQYRQYMPMPMLPTNAF